MFDPQDIAKSSEQDNSSAATRRSGTRTTGTDQHRRSQGDNVSSSAGAAASGGAEVRILLAEQSQSTYFPATCPGNGSSNASCFNAAGRSNQEFHTLVGSQRQLPQQL
eukprot:GSA25T00022232001.1